LNSAHIWIVFPSLVAVILLLLRKRETLVAILATGTAAVLAGLAAWLPVQEQIIFWRWVFPFSDTFMILGRRIVLSAADRPSLIVIYLTAALWFGAAPLARPNRLFVPLGLGMVTLLTAAIAVEPFLFAAVLIEIAVLVSIPFLSPPGSRTSRGVLRYLSFQTIGMPFILISGFMFTGFEVGPGNQEFVAIATALLAIGFALLLAVFPFHTWIPMLAEDSHPYPTAFVLLLLPVAVSIFGLGFLDSYVWFKSNPSTALLFQLVGVVMVVTAGIWAAVERQIVRLMGFAIILDIGFSLITISLAIGGNSDIYRVLFFVLLLPRGLSLGVWALALSGLMERIEVLNLENIRGLGKSYPVISISIILSIFCIAGMPLLAGFPLKLNVIEGLSVNVPQISLWLIIGSLGLIVGGIRILISMVSDADETREDSPEPRVLRTFLVIGLAFLFILGILPNFFFQLIINLPSAFGPVVP
jgi:NADH-quinone oxidoreductase subunit N